MLRLASLFAPLEGTEEQAVTPQVAKETEFSDKWPVNYRGGAEGDYYLPAPYDQGIEGVYGVSAALTSRHRSVLRMMSLLPSDWE